MVAVSRNDIEIRLYKYGIHTLTSTIMVKSASRGARAGVQDIA